MSDVIVSPVHGEDVLLVPSTTSFRIETIGRRADDDVYITYSVSILGTILNEFDCLQDAVKFCKGEL